MTENSPYSRICWFDWDGKLQSSHWYPQGQATEHALAACRTRWPELKFWKEEGRPSSVIELTIQDMFWNR